MLYGQIYGFIEDFLYSQLWQRCASHSAAGDSQLRLRIRTIDETALSSMNLSCTPAGRVSVILNLFINKLSHNPS